MTRVRFCILGAGPSGLAFAHALQAAGETSFVVVEKEAEAGGLCRSRMVDGGPLDIGGGHFLDVRQPEVMEFLFRFLPREEWIEHGRLATLRLRGAEIEHPIESHLWQLPTNDQLDFLESLAGAGCVRGDPCPEEFAAWIRWKLGGRIADEYMLPYNRKLWSIPLEHLGTHWLHKLPSVSFREALESCLLQRTRGTLPAHGRFLYPVRFGYGEVWKRMGEALGDRLMLDCPVEAIDLDQRTVNRVFRYDRLVTTIPWPAWLGWGVLPSGVAAAVGELVHVSIDVDYHPENCRTGAHWTYEPAETARHHRILFRHNFCPGARGHWTETNVQRSGVADGFRFRNEYAYPAPTLATPGAIRAIHRWASSHEILPLGRWGAWEHLNSDVAVHRALEAAHVDFHA
jgi:protoporphyrinogen oxidase